MVREQVVQEIKYLNEITGGPFPYDGIRKMRKHEKLSPHFEALGDDDWLVADFNTYCMCIAGIASRFSKGTENEIPKPSLQWLAIGDFFTIFPQYRFLEDDWEAFPDFAHCYSNTKRMQELELSLLLSQDELLALKTHNPTREWGHFLGPLVVVTVDDDKSQDDQKFLEDDNA